MSEATFLAAVAMLPLSFSFLTQTAWEPDKAIVLLLLATVIAGASAAQLALRYPRVALSIPRDPIIITGLLLLVAIGASTVFSIDARRSLFGSLDRRQGLLTWISCAVFFLYAWSKVRTSAQASRLVTVLILASVPATIYGLMQQIGLDPLPATGDPTVIQWPVRSVFGQHVFFGAYLVIVVPITAARVLQILGQRQIHLDRSVGDEPIIAGLAVLFMVTSFVGILALASHVPAVSALLPLALVGYVLLALAVEGLPNTRGMYATRLYGYTVILVLQVAAVVSISARGSWVGLAGAAGAFGLCLVMLRGPRRVGTTVLAAVAVITIFVGLLNVQGGPLESFRSINALHRVSNLLSTSGNDSGATSSRGRLMVWRGTATLFTHHPTVGPAWGGTGRNIVGYGPDTMQEAFERVYPVDLRRFTVDTRFVDRAHDIYLQMLTDFGILGLAAFVILIVLFYARTISRLRQPDNGMRWLHIGLIGAMTGHLVEGIFGIETTVTLFLFWLILGLAASHQDPELSSTESVGGEVSISQVLGYWVAVAVCFAALLVLPDAGSHVSLLAVLWITAMLVGIAVMSRMIWARRSVADDRALKMAPPGRTNVPVQRVILAFVACCLVVALTLQWRIQDAAYAVGPGSVDFGGARFADGLGYIRDAAGAGWYEPSYLVSLGTAYTSLARLAQSSADPQYQPRPSDPYTIDPQRAVLLNRKQLSGLAIMTLRHARALAPLELDAYDALGDAYTVAKQPQQALAVYREAHQLSPTAVKYLVLEALAQSQAGELTTALATAQTAQRMDSRYWYPYFALARIYSRLSQHGKAREAAKQALFWQPLTWPPVPQPQLSELQQLETSG